MTWQQVKDNMMANDPKKAAVYSNMVSENKRVEWNVEEIIKAQQQLTSMIFLINDFGDDEQMKRALPKIAAVREILEELEVVAKENDISWQSKRAAMMRKQIEEQDDPTS
jgi:ribosomal protein L17